MKQTVKFAQMIKNLMLWFISFVMLMPFILIIINSFKSRAEADGLSIALPSEWHWDNYMIVIEQGRLVRYFFNSLTYSTLSVTLGVMVSAMAAYVLSRNQTRLNYITYLFLIMGIAMPTNYVTLTKIMQLTGLLNTYVGIILLYACTVIPFSVFLIYNFVSTVQKELDEAAIVDGCSPLKLFVKIIFPLLKPVIVTVALLNFVMTWGQFILPIYFLHSSDKFPMTLAVYNFFGQYFAQWNYVSANIVLTTLPVVIIFLFGQKYIVSGMTAGSVKG